MQSSASTNTQAEHRASLCLPFNPEELVSSQISPFSLSFLNCVNKLLSLQLQQAFFKENEFENTLQQLLGGISGTSENSATSEWLLTQESVDATEQINWEEVVMATDSTLRAHSEVAQELGGYLNMTFDDPSNTPSAYYGLHRVPDTPSAQVGGTRHSPSAFGAHSGALAALAAQEGTQALSDASKGPLAAYYQMPMPAGSLGNHTSFVEGTCTENLKFDDLAQLWEVTPQIDVRSALGRNNAPTQGISAHWSPSTITASIYQDNTFLNNDCSLVHHPVGNVALPQWNVTALQYSGGIGLAGYMRNQNWPVTKVNGADTVTLEQDKTCIPALPGAQERSAVITVEVANSNGDIEPVVSRAGPIRSTARIRRCRNKINNEGRERRYKCSHCEHRCFSEGDLRTHQKVHLAPSYFCPNPACISNSHKTKTKSGKPGFVRTDSLKRHMEAGSMIECGSLASQIATQHYRAVGLVGTEYIVKVEDFNEYTFDTLFNKPPMAVAIGVLGAGAM